jgi:peptidoglycan-associated lipoprotein
MSQDIYFDFHKAVLTPQAKNRLSEVGDILKREPRLVVLTEGHTDERGTEQYNQAFGQRRSEAVYRYLTDYGVPASNLRTPVSYGELRPKAQGHDEDAWRLNRRAEFKVEITN